MQQPEPPQREPKQGIVGTNKAGAKLVAVAVIGFCLVLVTRSCNTKVDGVGPPSDALYRASAKQVVRSMLRDPNSAEFREVRLIPAIAGRSPTVCGRVNARNGFGGMAGEQRFIVGETSVLESEVGAPLMDQLWSKTC